MDIFDSATPEMKRIRNQRKDGNVLEHMMATSLEIEPAEISYHANGDFRASRDIFGPLSTENSPVCRPVTPLIHSSLRFGLLNMCRPTRSMHHRRRSARQHARQTLLFLTSRRMPLLCESHAQREREGLIFMRALPGAVHQCNHLHFSPNQH